MDGHFFDNICAMFGGVGPSGKRRMARIVPQEADGTVRVEWTPIEAGKK